MIQASETGELTFLLPPDTQQSMANCFDIGFKRDVTTTTHSAGHILDWILNPQLDMQKYPLE